jgi:lysophospholipase L1-like esterase
MRRSWIVVIALVIVVAGPMARPAVSASVSRQSGPYYLSLGAGVAAGYIPGGRTDPHGMANQFFAILQHHGVKRLLNFGCVEESAQSFIHGPCPWWFKVAAHYGAYPRASSQLAAALSFIHDHPGQVKYVTLILGGNDVDEVNVGGGLCLWNGSNLSKQLALLDTRFRSILSQLKAALGKHGVLVVMNLYDATATVCAKNRAALAVVPTLNRHEAADAAAYGVPVADLYSAFGGPAAPNPRLCTLTRMCGTSPDERPTTAGHTVIAQALKKAAGL